MAAEYLATATCPYHQSLFLKMKVRRNREFALQMHHFAINGILKIAVTAYLAGLSIFPFNVGRHTKHNLAL